MIKRDELLRMAREAGFDVVGPNHYLSEVHVEAEGFIELRLEAFANAIIERAAVECESVEGMYWHGDGASAATSCIDRIRALKTQGE